MNSTCFCETGASQRGLKDEALKHTIRTQCCGFSEFISSRLSALMKYPESISLAAFKACNGQEL